jgi:diadenosine tetraphosphate (Ap4A) HIT family hydrolase
MAVSFAINWQKSTDACGGTQPTSSADKTKTNGNLFRWSGAPRIARQARSTDMDCELCKEDMLLFGDNNAFVRHDSNSLSKGHVLVVPRRHVADFFDMTWEEKTSILALLDKAKAQISREHSPDGYNIGVNIGKAAGQARMHVHVHLIPRYAGDVADPRGGIRCVLTKGK